MNQEFFRFAFVGGIAAGINWLSRIGISLYLSLEIAVVISYLIGMATAYVLNKHFVFDDSGRKVSDEVLRFTLVNIVAMAQVWLVTVGLVRFIFPALDWSWHPAEIAHAIGVASPIITSYFGHRYFTFSRNSGQ